MKEKFIITKDQKTANALIASGFKLASQIGGTYTFINMPPQNFSFAGVDKSKYCFSNILSM